jgi:DNA repair protein RadC
LTNVPGIGPKTAAALRAALELGRRLMSEAVQDEIQIRSPEDAARILLPMLSYQEQENFTILYLNTRNHVVDKEILYRGSLNTSLVRIAEVFKGAVRRNCAAIIVAHNHPSGDPEPSPEDVALTRRLIQAGELLEVELLDHVVVGNTRYVSMRERKLGFADV